MIHIISDEWALPEFGDGVFCIRLNPDVFNLIKIKNLSPLELMFSNIAHRELDTINFDSERYKNANVDYPGVVVTDMPNPYNKKFRMIDGRHRLIKQMEKGKVSGLFYVLEYDDIKKYITKQ